MRCIEISFLFCGERVIFGAYHGPVRDKFPSLNSLSNHNHKRIFLAFYFLQFLRLWRLQSTEGVLKQRLCLYYFSKILTLKIPLFLFIYLLFDTFALIFSVSEKPCGRTSIYTRNAIASAVAISPSTLAVVETTPNKSPAKSEPSQYTIIEIRYAKPH